MTSINFNMIMGLRKSQATAPFKSAETTTKQTPLKLGPIRRSMGVNRSRLPELQRLRPVRKTLGNIESDQEDCPFKPARGISQLRRFKAPEVSKEGVFPKG